MTEEENIKNFWDWFQANEHKYLFLSDVADNPEELKSLIDELHQAFQKCYPEGITFEIGGKQDSIEKLDLYITAEGVLEHFPKVEKMVDLAPEFENWNIVKFKQPSEEPLTLKIEDKEFDPTNIQIIPLGNRNNPNAVGFHVCYDDYTDAERNLYLTATYIMLDALLGEKSVTLDIDYMDVVKTPEILKTSLPLSEIAQFVKGMKEKGHQRYKN